MVVSVWNKVAAAAMMLAPGAAHGAANIAAGPPAVVVLPQGAGIENFYVARRNALLWFDGGRANSAAAELIRILRRAPIDGLASGPALAAKIEQAIKRSRNGDPRLMASADWSMSSAWVAYVQALRAPTAGMIYGDPSLTARAALPSLILRDAARAPILTTYLASVSAVNPTYMAIRNAALSEARETGSTSPRLLANLDRARAIPATGRFILVDAAAQRLDMVDAGQVVDTMKVIVGKPKYATPMIASRINYATLNPYWHVPEHLVREIIAVNVVTKGVA